MQLAWPDAITLDIMPQTGPGQEPDIARLTGRMVKGDEMAYRTFYELYFNRLLRYLLVVMGGQEEAAREAIQLTLLRVVRHIRVFDSEAILWSWLTVLARSSIVDEERKRSRYLSFLDRFFERQQIDAESAGCDTDAHLLALLERNLAALPEDDRHLIVQKYLHSGSVRDLASDRQSTEKTIESRLGRIRKQLREAILKQLKHEA